jgi:hypothetical protein
MGFVKNLIILAVGVVTLVSCSTPEGPGNSFEVLIPQNDDSGGYSLEVVEVSGVESFSPFRTKDFEFVLTPESAFKKLKGDDVKLNLVQRADGVFVPQDTVTSEVLALYSYLVPLKRDFEDLLGKDLPQQQVGVRVRIDAGHGDEIIQNQALYYGETQAFMFTVFSEKTLALTLNFGVIAHEYFHYVMDLVVAQPSGYREDLSSYVEVRKAGEELGVGEELFYMNSVLFRGLNEGVADFWGWSYSFDTDFVSRSLASVEGRSLKSLPGRLPSVGEFESQVFDRIGSDLFLELYAYTELAPTYARLLKSLVQARSGGKVDKKIMKEFRKLVFDSLTEYNSVVEGEWTRSLRSTNDFMNVMAEQMQELSRAECSLLTKSLAVDEISTQVMETCL